MFDEPSSILAGLKHLRHKRHEVVVWHILDAAEVDFPFQEATLFRGLEEYPDLLTDPRRFTRKLSRTVDGVPFGVATRLPWAEYRLCPA